MRLQRHSLARRGVDRLQSSNRSRRKSLLLSGQSVCLVEAGSRGQNLLRRHLTMGVRIAPLASLGIPEMLGGRYLNNGPRCSGWHCRPLGWRSPRSRPQGRRLCCRRLRSRGSEWHFHIVQKTQSDLCLAFQRRSWSACGQRNNLPRPQRRNQLAVSMANYHVGPKSGIFGF